MIERLREEYIKQQSIYCSGCGLGILMNCFVHALDESGLDKDKIVIVSGIGCTGRMAGYFKMDGLHTTHGRALSFATGVKLSNPELKVIVISGDGDLVTIGGNHLIHTARRNFPLTVIFANNFIYAMTNGQAGSTTPLGAKTSTTPWGNEEPPFDIVSLLLAAGAKMVLRYPIAFPRLLIKGLKKALEFPFFSLAEVVTPCFSYYGRRNGFSSPVEMIRQQKRAYIPKKRAESSPLEELESKTIFGEFCNLGEYLELIGRKESC